jgi:hypothetical protein
LILARCCIPPCSGTAGSRTSASRERSRETEETALQKTIERPGREARREQRTASFSSARQEI